MHNTIDENVNYETGGILDDGSGNGLFLIDDINKDILTAGKP